MLQKIIVKDGLTNTNRQTITNKYNRTRPFTFYSLPGGTFISFPGCGSPLP